MARTPQDVTDSELAIMEVLWEHGRATVRQLSDAVYGQVQGTQTATVKKLLERLQSKHCVSADRQCWPHEFFAVVDRGELIGRQLQSTADRLCEGSFQPLLSNLVRSRRLTPAERKSLRGLLDELDHDAQGNRKS